VDDLWSFYFMLLEFMGEDLVWRSASSETNSSIVSTPYLGITFLKDLVRDIKI
jgi:hypothetical protein